MNNEPKLCQGPCKRTLPLYTEDEDGNKHHNYSEKMYKFCPSELKTRERRCVKCGGGKPRHQPQPSSSRRHRSN